MEFFRNIAINLKVTGPAAVIIAWIIGISTVGIFGEGGAAMKALYTLQFVGPLIIIGMGQKIS